MPFPWNDDPDDPNHPLIVGGGGPLLDEDDGNWDYCAWCDRRYHLLDGWSNFEPYCCEQCAVRASADSEEDIDPDPDYYEPDMDDLED